MVEIAPKFGAATAPATTADVAQTMRSIAIQAKERGFYPIVYLPVCCEPSTVLEAGIREVGRAGGAVVVPVAMFSSGCAPYPALLSHRLETVIPVGTAPSAKDWHWLVKSRWGALSVCGSPRHLTDAANCIREFWLAEGTLGAAMQAIRSCLAKRAESPQAEVSSVRSAPLSNGTRIARAAPSSAGAVPRIGRQEPIRREPNVQSNSAAIPERQSDPRGQNPAIEYAFFLRPPEPKTSVCGALTFRTYGPAGGVKVLIELNERLRWCVDVRSGGPYTCVELLPVEHLRVGPNTLRFRAVDERGRPARPVVESVIVQLGAKTDVTQIG